MGSQRVRHNWACACTHTHTHTHTHTPTLLARCLWGFWNCLSTIHFTTLGLTTISNRTDPYSELSTWMSLISKRHHYPFLHVIPRWLRQERICLQCRRSEFYPCIGKIPWRREWQTTPVFLPGESHGRGSWQFKAMGSQRVRHGWVTNILPSTAFSSHCLSTTELWDLAS